MVQSRRSCTLNYLEGVCRGFRMESRWSQFKRAVTLSEERIINALLWIAALLAGVGLILVLWWFQL